MIGNRLAEAKRSAGYAGWAFGFIVLFVLIASVWSFSNSEKAKQTQGKALEQAFQVSELESDTILLRSQILALSPTDLSNISDSIESQVEQIVQRLDKLGGANAELSRNQSELSQLAIEFGSSRFISESQKSSLATALKSTSRSLNVLESQLKAKAKIEASQQKSAGNGGDSKLLFGLVFGLVAISIVAFCAVRKTIKRFDTETANLNDENEEFAALSHQLEDKNNALLAQQEELREALENAENQTAMQEHASLRFQSLFNGLPVGAMTFDESGTVFEANLMLGEIFETEIHFALLNHVTAVMKAQGREEQVLVAISKAIQEKEESKFDWEFDTIKHGRRVVSMMFFPLTDHNSRAVGGIGVAVDVTNQRKAESQIAEMAGLQKAVIDAAEYSIISTDQNGMITGFNRAAEAMFHVLADQVVGERTLDSLLFSSELELRRVELEEEMGIELEFPGEALYYSARQGMRERQEWTYQLPGGSFHIARLSMSPLHNSDGEVIGFLGVGRCIDKDKADAERMRMLSMVAERAANSVLITDACGLILFANPAFTKTCGYEFTDVSGKSPLDFLYSGSSDPYMLIQAKEAFMSHRTTNGDLEIVRKDGSMCWMRCSFTPVEDDEGICSHIVIIQEDITEQKEFELKLMESEQRFRDVVEAAGEYIWEINHRGKFTYISEQVLDVMGYLPGELEGKSPFDFMEFDEADSVKEKIEQQVESAGTFKDIIAECKGRDGRPIWIRFNGKPIYDQENRLTGYRGTGLDITQQRLAEKRLAKANLRNRTMLESIRDSFYSLDRNGTFIYANKTAAAFAKTPTGELIGQNIRDVLYDDYWQDAIDRMLETFDSHEPVSFEFFNVNEASWLEFRAYASEESISIFFQDITDRKMIQRQLEDQMAQLNEANVQLDMQKMELEEANVRLQNLASTDGLTGLKNHKTFQEFLQSKFETAKVGGSSLAVVLMDVDKFKTYNDSFGHPAGDEVLKGVAQALARTVTEPHLVARYGGEEFVMVLVGVSEEEAVAIADEARMEIEDRDWPHREITASFGVCLLSPDITSRAEMIERADQALYVSKEGGRNQVSLWTPEVMAA